MEIVTGDRTLAPEVMSMSLTPALRAVQERGVAITVGWLPEEVARDGNGLRAVPGSDFSGMLKDRQVDQVAVNAGVLPLDNLYFELKPLSVNLGERDDEAFIDGRAQELVRNRDGALRLFRIGDAVSSRNTHAAIYDGLRLAKAL